VIAHYITFIARHNPIPQELINECNIKQGHINLIKRCYFQYDTSDGNCVMLAYKRPFGNSYVMGDVLHEFGIKHRNEYLEETVQ
jgi:hypothetical protein